MDQREAAARNGRWEGRRGGHGITPQASGDEGNTQTFTEDHGNVVNDHYHIDSLVGISHGYRCKRKCIMRLHCTTVLLMEGFTTLFTCSCATPRLV